MSDEREPKQAAQSLDHKSQNLKKMITDEKKREWKGVGWAKIFYFFFCLLCFVLFLIKVKTITFKHTKGMTSSSHIIPYESALNVRYTLSPYVREDRTQKKFIQNFHEQKKTVPKYFFYRQMWCFAFIHWNFSGERQRRDELFFFIWEKILACMSEIAAEREWCGAKRDDSDRLEIV